MEPLGVRVHLRDVRTLDDLCDVHAPGPVEPGDVVATAEQRTAIGKACKAARVRPFSPHDLRHRRISLLHLRGVPWARIGEQVGQRNLALTANTYTRVLADKAELDYAALLAVRR